MKKNKKLWSYALAGALAVSNLSVVMTPLTAYAADPVPSTLPTSFTEGTWANSFTNVGTTAAPVYDTADVVTGKVSYTITDDLSAEVATGLWYIEVTSGSTKWDAGTDPSKLNTALDGGIGGAGVAIEDKLDFSAVLGGGETATFTLMYDQDGTSTGYSPIEVSSQTYTFKTAAGATELKGVVTLTGDSSVYTANDIDLSLAIGNMPEGYYFDTTSTFIVGTASGSEIAVANTGDYSGAEAYAETKKATFTPATEGTAKIGVWLTTQTTDAQALDIKEIAVTKSDITSLTATGTGKYLGIYETNVKNTGITVDVTESYNNAKGGKQVKWAIVKDYGSTTATPANATSDFTIKVNGGNDSTTKATVTPFPGTSFTDTAVIGAGAGLNASADAGKYTVIAFTGGEIATTATTFADPVATYEFEVVDAPDLSIQDDDGNPTATLYVGQSVDLGLYYETGATSTKKATSPTFSLVNESDSEFVSISGNTATILKHKTSGGSTIKIGASYNIKDGVNDKTATAEEFTITTQEDGLTAAFGPRTPKDLNTAGELEIGHSTTLVAKFAGVEVKASDGVKWSADNANATITDDGVVTAVTAANSAGVVNFKATLTKDGKKYESNPVGLTIAALAYSIEDEDGVDVGTNTGSGALALGIGKSELLTLVPSNGTISGVVEWNTTNKSVATVEDGLVTVNANAKLGQTATISVSVDGTPVDGTVLTVTAPKYTAKNNGTGTLTAGAVGTYTADLYKGQTLDFDAFYDDNPVDGAWQLSTAAGITNANITLSGNVVTATTNTDTTATAVDQVLFFADDNQTTTPNLTVTITIHPDEFNMYLKGDESTTILDGGAALTPNSTTPDTDTITITDMEVGESIEYVAKIGGNDVTTDGMVWTLGTEAEGVLQISNGKLTAIGEGSGATATASYVVNGTPEIVVTITVVKVYKDTGATKAAETAISEAETAIDAADTAIDAADAATKASEEVKKTPTAANLAKANDALTEAKEELSNAQKALDNAKAAYDEAVASGAKSAGAQEAVDKAEAAVKDAEAAVAKADAAVTEAKTAFDEAASDVEKAIAAAVAEADTKAAAAEAAPSDDTIAAAKAAVEAAKAVGATDEQLKTANDKIAAAEAAKAAADKKSDGSAANTPAPVNTELKDAAGNVFKVTTATAGQAEVEFAGPADKNATKFTIPDTIKDASGNEYKVTSIAAGAFKDSKAKTVTIGKNIKSIDKNAFKDSKIKTVKIKGTKLTKKMAKAFNKLKKGAKIKVSGKNKKKNKKLLNALKNVKNGNIKVK